MGLDITLRPKYYKDSSDCNIYLSRYFCTFIIGEHRAHTDTEYNQIERILEIDLSLFRQVPINMEPDIDYLEYEYYLAEDAKDAPKMEEIKKQIKNIEEEWKATYHEINEGWIKVEDLRAKTQEFINKILANPDYWKEMEFNLPWQKYFITNYYYEEPKTEYEKEFKKHLLIDLHTILNVVDCVEKNNQEYIGFRYG